MKVLVHHDTKNVFNIPHTSIFLIRITSTLAQHTQEDVKTTNT